MLCKKIWGKNMGMLKDLFGSKKRNSPDVLGRYPEYMQVRALPERRYLKTSRLLAAFILINLGITLALGGIYAYLAERVEVSIMSRKAVNLFYIDTEKKQLFPVEHHQKTVSALQLLAEDYVNKYIKERHTILVDVNEMKKILGGQGIVGVLSERKIVWEKFMVDAKREDALARNKGYVRDVLIYELEYLYGDMWQAIFEEFDMPIPDPFNPLCNECLTDEANSPACISCKKQHALARRRYKAFVRVNFNNLKTISNPLGVMIYSYQIIPMVVRDDSFWDTPRALKPEL